MNRFYIYNRKVNARGSINLDREICINPIEKSIPRNTSWGGVSSISTDKRMKYQENSSFWQIYNPLLKDITTNEDFLEDNLNKWVSFASNFVVKSIKTRENQEKRLPIKQ